VLTGAQVTFEAPPGLKRNLQRTYEGWDADFISSGPPLRAQLLFVLAWFHAVVQVSRWGRMVDDVLPHASKVLEAASARPSQLLCAALMP
jgi:hypothetical protein